jgi:phosphotransferase family enzyme
VSAGSANPDRVSTEELRGALERSLSDHFGSSRRITSLERSPSVFTSSFALEELEIETDDGTELNLMFKDLGGSGLSERARAAKPEFLYDPLREIEAYGSILSEAALGTATFYGSAVDPGNGRYWLFIENVRGTALWQIGELERWKAVARWAAALHSRFADAGPPATERLLHYDADLYRLWLRRAVDFADRWEARRPGAGRKTIEWLAERYDSVVERLESLPATFIHGELYASNILVVSDGDETRVCPIDWEIAAMGPGLIDLAALTMGWNRETRIALARAYREAHTRPDRLPASKDFLEALDSARLHLAVQWLGWAPDWRPPRSHRRDWVSEASTIAEELGL